ncbi:hypothetical protein MRX96_001771 [Rhipicephalus microplus]
MVSGPSQVADMYKTLETLTAFGEKERTRQDSTRASNTTFNIRMELSSITDRYFSSPARRRLKRLLAVSLLAITLLTIVAASVFLLYPKPKRRLRSYCETKGCEAHRYQISHQLDKSIDPCDDFSAYVCARWKPRKEFQLSRSQLSDMFLSWLYKLPETLAKGVVHFPVGKKVAAIFDSCMTETGSHVPVMREFMRDRDILWPDDPEEPVTPAKTPLRPLFQLERPPLVHLENHTRHFGRKVEARLFCPELPYGAVEGFNQRDSEDIFSRASTLNFSKFFQATRVGTLLLPTPRLFFSCFHGSEHRAEEERPRFCAGQIEPGYKLLIAAMATVAHFSENERRNIDHLLGNILQVAVDKTWACSWFDNDTKQAAAGKTHKHVHRGLAPGKHTCKLLNHLSLSLGALAPPLYYPDGTNAMLYGGVLYLYARALITAVGNEGFTVNAEAEVTSSWLSREVQKAFSLRALHCLPGGVSIFPEVPAMEVAYEAFKRRIDKNNTLPLSEDLTEEKVFFITACLSTCARTPSDNLFGGDCNKAVMNFAPFAEAFNCPAGSKMNPKNKCSYYD